VSAAATLLCHDAVDWQERRCRYAADTRVAGCYS
jgi:hypothetical protein